MYVCMYVCMYISMYVCTCVCILYIHAINTASAVSICSHID